MNDNYRPTKTIKFISDFFYISRYRLSKLILSKSKLNYSIFCKSCNSFKSNHFKNRVNYIKYINSIKTKFVEF